MITCSLRYTIDPYQLAAFERYSRLILPPAAAAACLVATISHPRVADRILPRSRPECRHRLLTAPRAPSPRGARH